MAATCVAPPILIFFLSLPAYQLAGDASLFWVAYEVAQCALMAAVLVLLFSYAVSLSDNLPTEKRYRVGSRPGVGFGA